MFDWLRRTILVVARVPAQPEPPAGAPGSVRIFRAGRNFYKLRVLVWCGAQVGAIAGIFFSLWFLSGIDAAVSLGKETAAQIQTQASIQDSANPDDTINADAKPSKKHKLSGRHQLAEKIADWPNWTITLIHWAEYAAIAIFILQIPITFAAVRLEYEQHWYIVTDRSLRIRTGLITLQESTMSFANLQQVEVKQGPLQRLLAIADVHVQSAGGGDTNHKGKSTDSMHHAIFNGVDNSHEIRDLILARLKKYRDSGLNDPDETNGQFSPPQGSNAALVAARDLLAEVRAFKSSLRV